MLEHLQLDALPQFQTWLPPLERENSPCGAFPWGRFTQEMEHREEWECCSSQHPELVEMFSADLCGPRAALVLR